MSRADFMKNNKKKNKNNKKVTKTDNDFVSDFSVNLHALSRFMKNLPKDARLKEMAGGRNVIEVKKILENNALNEMLISNQQLICDHLRDEAEVYHEIQNLIFLAAEPKRKCYTIFYMYLSYPNGLLIWEP